MPQLAAVFLVLASSFGGANTVRGNQLLIPLYNYDNYVNTMLAKFDVSYTPENTQVEKKITGKFLIVPNACFSILFARQSFTHIDVKTHSTTIDFQFYNDMNSMKELNGVWKDFNIQQNQVTLGGRNANLNDYNQKFSLALKMFVTQETPYGIRDLNLDGIIGMSPCLQTKDSPQENVLSFFYQWKSSLGSEITDLMWDIDDKNNDKSPNNVGNGFLKVNFGKESSFKQSFKLNFKQLLIYQLNQIFEIDKSDNLPKKGVNFTYNFDCGPIIGSTKFKDSINLYSAQGNTDFNNVSLNMLPRFMQVDSSTVDYIHEYFMLRCENVTLKNFLIDTEIFQCPVSILGGFPSVVMTLDTQTKRYEFSFNDFFLFPTVKKDTTASEAFFGFIEYSKLSPTIKPDVLQDFQFGQLFVQKYGLHIKYEQVQDTGLYLADIYTKVVDGKTSVPWGNIIFWVILVIIGTLFLYSIYLRKKNRIRNEDQTTKRLLEELMERDLNVKDDNFEELRMELISGIHQTMLKVIDQDQLKQKIKFTHIKKEE